LNFLLPIQIFTDMANTPLEAWAELAYNDGIITACQTSPLQFCPSGAVTRTQAAIYLLLTKHGSSYTPPDVGNCTGFNDVPITAYAAAWIKELNVENIAIGCGGGNYCSDASIRGLEQLIYRGRETDQGADILQ
jgi:hypothetical protein